MYKYRTEGRIKKKKHRTRKIKSSQSPSFKTVTQYTPKTEIIEANRINECCEDSNSTNERIKPQQFSFSMYKESIEYEYNLHLRMKEEEEQRFVHLTLPFPLC